jgi:phosphatidylglycerophosphatase A
LKDRLAILIATGAGAGFTPKAPGTAGAIEGVLIYLFMEWRHLGAYYPHVILAFFIAGTWAAHHVESLWGHDAQRIVVDEIIGQMITFGIAAGRFRLSALNVFIGFVLFRLFDITKPFPIRRLEGLPGGLGVIADDVGAGIYALIGLALIIKVFGA